jgi:hypothetical protein
MGIRVCSGECRRRDPRQPPQVGSWRAAPRHRRRHGSLVGKRRFPADAVVRLPTGERNFLLGLRHVSPIGESAPYVSANRRPLCISRLVSGKMLVFRSLASNLVPRFSVA